MVKPLSGNHSRLSPQPLSKHFPYEPIYSYPSVAQMASRTKIPDIDITFVGAVTFHQICKESGVEPILLCTIHSEVLAWSTKTEPKVELSEIDIPEEYWEFADVFDKVEADVLPEH